MRNVTIRLDDDTARWIRIEAAMNDTSVSRLIADVLQEHMQEKERYELARRSYLARDARPISEQTTRYPTRDEVHAR